MRLGKHSKRGNVWRQPAQQARRVLTASLRHKKGRGVHLHKADERATTATTAATAETGLAMGWKTARNRRATPRMSPGCNSRTTNAFSDVASATLFASAALANSSASFAAAFLAVSATSAVLFESTAFAISSAFFGSPVLTASAASSTLFVSAAV